MLGACVRVASPTGFGLPDRVVEDVARIARAGGSLECVVDPVAAVTGADAVYTDVWTSMGQENETDKRLAVFAPYQVNGGLMSHAQPDALFMHCLPAHRGFEVTDEVIDSSASVVFDQAENRLHVQKALLAMIAHMKVGGRHRHERQSEARGCEERRERAKRREPREPPSRLTLARYGGQDGASRLENDLALARRSLGEGGRERVGESEGQSPSG